MYFNIKTDELYSREEAAMFFARRIADEFDCEPGAIAAETVRYLAQVERGEAGGPAQVAFDCYWRPEGVAFDSYWKKAAA